MRNKVIVAGVSNLDAVRDALAEVPVKIEVAEAWEPLVPRLEFDPPACIVVDCDTHLGAAVCLGARSVRALAHVPVVAVVGAPTAAGVRKALALGVDDFVPEDEAGQLARKVLVADRHARAPIPDRSACVVLADPSRRRRVHLARHLRGMGLDVRFAVNHLEVVRETGARLVVAAAGLPSVGAIECMKAARRRSELAEVPWIVLGDLEHDTGPRALVDDEPGVAFLGGREDPAQIVTLANRMLRRDAPTLRASERLPLSVPALLEVGPQRERMWACTYNFSLGGLFVRTLTPPPVGTELQVTLDPSGEGKSVTAPASVVWRIDGTAGHPPGFGAQFGETISAVAMDELRRVHRALAGGRSPERGIASRGAWTRRPQLQPAARDVEA